MWKSKSPPLAEELELSNMPFNIKKNGFHCKQRVMSFMATSNYQITKEQPSSDNSFIHLHIYFALTVLNDKLDII